MTAQVRTTWLAVGVIATLLLFGMPDPIPWHVSRASGVVSYLMLWLATASGLASSSRIGRMFLPAPELFDIHSFSAYLLVLGLGIHVLALLADGWIAFSISGVLIPGFSEYRPVPVATGIVASYVTFIATFSFHLRSMMGTRRWRKLHYLVFPGYALALIHSVLAGTDASSDWAQVMYLGSAVIILFLVFLRILGGAEIKVPTRNVRSYK